MSKEIEFTELLTSTINACSESSSDFGRAVDGLKLLTKWTVTVDLLSKTDAGRKIKKLFKSSDEQVAKTAAACVGAWKECVRLEGLKPKDSSDGPLAPSTTADPVAPPGGEKASQSGRAEIDTMPSTSTAHGSALPLPSSSHQTGPSAIRIKPVKSTGDATRDKIVGLLSEALALGAVGPSFDGSSEEGELDPSAVAVEVEAAMFQQNGGVNPQYKAKYRTLAFNLKDPNNPDLRCKVLRGLIPADLLVNLTTEELASDERRQGNDKIRDHMKKECERGQSNVASTDMFQCGKCKQRKTTYYQLQTRSADEPMTTFVTCVNCNNRWKFC